MVISVEEYMMLNNVNTKNERYQKNHLFDENYNIFLAFLNFHSKIFFAIIVVILYYYVIRSYEGANGGQRK